MTTPPAGNRKTGRWVPPAVRRRGYQLTTLPEGAVQTRPLVSVSTWHLVLDSLSPGAIILGSSHIECPLRSHPITTVCFFPNVFSQLFLTTVINSHTPSLKRQSKLHRDLRRTIVCLYAQSINLNSQLSHYMPTIKQ